MAPAEKKRGKFIFDFLCCTRHFFALDLTGAQRSKSKRRGLMAACVRVCSQSAGSTCTKKTQGGEILFHCFLAHSTKQPASIRTEKSIFLRPIFRHFKVRAPPAGSSVAALISFRSRSPSISSGVILNNNSAVSERSRDAP
jgi:hypothetical protein